MANKWLDFVRIYLGNGYNCCKNFDLTQVPAVVFFDCTITNNNKKRESVSINNQKANKIAWQEVQKNVLFLSLIHI